MSNAPTFTIEQANGTYDSLPAGLKVMVDNDPDLVMARGIAAGRVWSVALSATLDYNGQTYSVAEAAERKQALYSESIKNASTPKVVAALVATGEFVSWTQAEKGKMGLRCLETEHKAELDALVEFMRPFNGVATNKIVAYAEQARLQLA